MLDVLASRTYRHLFAAQVIALAGTGLLTVALGLLAFELAGADAGVVLGTALAIKMVAYVGVAPIVGAFANQLPRRAFLVSMDLVRAAMALLLPFITEVWQIYVLIFLLQSASAAFTPTFQATIPDVLPDERDYTRALSLSRLGYDLESLLSPALAAALLTVISFHWLFGGTVVGFLCSAALVLSVTLPWQAHAKESGIFDKTTRGMHIFFKTPRLRGIMALNLSVATASTMVIVNTVVIVNVVLGLSDNDFAVALGCFGAGSMAAALLLPRILDEVSDRTVMIWASWLLGIVLLASAAVGWVGTLSWPALIIAWTLLGVGRSAVQIPIGRLLRRSAQPADRPALFAAQFSLSHACALLTYPLAGWLGALAGIPITLAVHGLITVMGVVVALCVWPASDPEVIEHSHPELNPDDPHIEEYHGRPHAHAFTIDDLHRCWPAKLATGQETAPAAEQT
jgi:MFS family permease